MNFVLNPSLEHMALVKIVISLWKQNDVRVLIMKPISGNRYSNEEWKTVEERVMKKVPQLSLPELLKEKVVGFIKPVGIEISEWMVSHCMYFDLPAHLPAELCWTPQGTVDRKRTAEVLVRDEHLDMPTRLKLACHYCLEDDIHKLCNISPEDLKESLLNTDFCYFNDWSSNIMRRESRNAPIDYKRLFEHCTLQNNKVAGDYFLQKLTSSEKEEFLVKIAKNVHKADVLFFLLSKLDEEQQIEVFKSDPYKVLKCFLQWPLQSFFIGVANLMWNFLSKNHYENILRIIMHKIRDGYKDCNYQKLFRELWQESPSALKSGITNEIDKSWLSLLFCVKDKEIIRIILRDTTLTVKNNLIYKMNTFCESFIRDNEWDFLEFCIRECFPAKSQMLKFKLEFEKRVRHSYFKQYFATKKHKWDQVFHLSDDSTCENHKRSLEEGESSSSKRFQWL